jgi:carboxylate-amine ligase
MKYQITLGAEEELQVVDQHTLELTAHDFEKGKSDFPDFHGTSSFELHKAVIEIQTPICNSADEIANSIRIMRTLIDKRAHSQGQRILSAGLHPFSDWKTQEIHKETLKHDHYIHLVDEYADIIRSLLSYGFHVHIGLPKEIPAIHVFNCLRNYLAAVLAISLSSPFYECRDTGVQSWRHSMLDRLPRMGTPDIWNSIEEYQNHIQILRKVGTLGPNNGMWEDLRLHHVYGTLEVRICDATASLEHIWLITALLQCEVYTLATDYQNNTLPTPLSRALLEDNKWRVRRRGLQATLIDWQTEQAMSVHDYFAQWLKRLEPAAIDLGIAKQLNERVAQLFTTGVSADIQRGIFKTKNSFHDVVSHLVLETEKPFSFIHPSRHV